MFHTEEVKEKLRKELPDRLKPWLVKCLMRLRSAPGRGRQRAPRRVAVSFEPADVINQVMSFGSPTPVEVVVSGPKLEDNRRLRRKGDRRDGKDHDAARPPVRPGVRLSAHQGGDRPRAGRPGRADRRRRGQRHDRRHLLEPLHLSRFTGPIPRAASAIKCSSRCPPPR